MLYGMRCTVPGIACGHTSNVRVMKQLLFFSDIPWEYLYQRPQHLATRLAGRWPVLWIEPATLGSPRKWSPVRVRDHFHVLTLPLFPHNARNQHVRRISRLLGVLPPVRWLLHHVQRILIQRALRKLNINRKTIAAVVENFQFISLIEYLRPTTLLFDYIDDAFGFIEYPEYVREEWQRTIRQATVITATTPTLQRHIERERSVHVSLVENGVETAAYMPDSPPLRPADLPPAHRPIIIYVGTIARWFDCALLEKALRGLPQFDFALVGPVHPETEPRLTEMRKFTNLYVLGQRAHTAIPAYLLASTVGMIPFSRTRLTEGVNPVKLYEYAAAGLPIVTTAFSDDLERFHDVAFIGRTPEQFITLLHSAVTRAREDDYVKRLRTFAVQNDWSTRSDTIISLLLQQTHNQKSAAEQP